MLKVGHVFKTSKGTVDELSVQEWRVLKFYPIKHASESGDYMALCENVKGKYKQMFSRYDFILLGLDEPFFCAVTQDPRRWGSYSK